MKKVLSFILTALAIPGLFCLGPIGMAETLADAIEGVGSFRSSFPWIAYFATSAWWLIHISHTNTAKL